MLSRSGFELNEIWDRQKRLVEADEKGRDLERRLSAGDESLRKPFVTHLRRTGQHDTADAHELAPHVANYQRAHKKGTQAGRDRLGKPHDRKVAEAAQKHGHERGWAYERMLNLGRQQLHRKLDRKPDPTGHLVTHDHEVAEHLAKHLDPEKTLDTHHQAQQIIDIHGHRHGQGGGTSGVGLDTNIDKFKAHALRRHENKPFDLRGPVWERKHSNGTPESEHGHDPNVEALKRSLTHHRAATVKSHDVHVHTWGEDTMALHRLTISPGASGEHQKHVIVRH